MSWIVTIKLSLYLHIITATYCHMLLSWFSNLLVAFTHISSYRSVETRIHPHHHHKQQSPRSCTIRNICKQLYMKMWLACNCISPPWPFTYPQTTISLMYSGARGLVIRSGTTSPKTSIFHEFPVGEGKRSIEFEYISKWNTGSWHVWYAEWQHLQLVEVLGCVGSSWRVYSKGHSSLRTSPHRKVHWKVHWKVHCLFLSSAKQSTGGVTSRKGMEGW